ARPWDLTGSLQVMAGLILCAYALKELGRASTSWLHAGLACAAGVAMLTVFVRRQRRRPYPLIDFAIFRNATFSSGVAAALFAGAALLGLELVFSQRLQLVLGMSPIQAALFILPLPLAAFVAGPVAGWLLAYVRGPRLMFLSLAVSAAGMGAYLLCYDGAVLPQMVSLSVLGLGIGATMTAASSSIMQSATPERAGMAASIEEVSYELGGALGVTLMGSILSGVYANTLDVPPALAAAPALRDSLDEALIVAEGLPTDLAATLTELARTAFDTGYAAVIATATVMLVATAAFVLLNRSRRQAVAA
ncbi:MAG TPA: MFS transporter, partial [Achromobacter sp.]|nr:MFS transporter [Achromobacter sp.]